MISDKELHDIYRLKNVVRYNTRNVIKHENVAEHTFNVAIISLMLCDKYNLTHSAKADCLIKAILHDMPEIELNDITHDVKERLGLRQMLKSYEDEYYEKNFSNYAKLMKDDNEDSLVNNIVGLADAFSVKQYILNEFELGNNSYEIKDIYKEICERIKKYEYKIDKLIRETKKRD